MSRRRSHGSQRRNWLKTKSSAAIVKNIFGAGGPNARHSDGAHSEQGIQVANSAGRFHLHAWW